MNTSSSRTSVSRRDSWAWLPFAVIGVAVAALLFLAGLLIYSFAAMADSHKAADPAIAAADTGLSFG
jgi:hypothetical protein